MRKIIKLILLLSTLLQMSCSIFVDPVGEQVIFYTRLLNNVVNSRGNLPENTTKDDLPGYNLWTSFHVVYSSELRSMGDSFLVFLQPIYNKNPVMFSEYPNGIPIMVFQNNGFETNDFNNGTVSYSSWRGNQGKGIIMINGFVEFADSSHNGYIILPIAPNSVGANFDIKKFSYKLKFRDRNGNFLDFNRENLRGGR